jgi:hypothetical protein
MWSVCVVGAECYRRLSDKMMREVNEILAIEAAKEASRDHDDDARGEAFVQYLMKHAGKRQEKILIVKDYFLRSMGRSE